MKLPARHLVSIAGLLLLSTLLITSSTLTSSFDETLNKPLLDAVRQGDLVSAQTLLQRGADVNCRDDNGATPVMNATVTADAGLMKALLSSGADPNATNKAGASALMWAVGDSEKVRLLVDHGADVNARAESGFTPLLMAANSEIVKETVELLLTKGAQVNAATGNGFTALMAAAGTGNPAVVDLLLRHGADPRAKNASGWSALHAAANIGSASVIKMLLDRGANANPQDSFQGRTPLIWAAATGNAEATRSLIEKGASLNNRETLAGTTALLCAAADQLGAPEIVRSLLDKSSDVAARDFAGLSALDWAERQGRSEVIELLKRHGAARGSEKPPNNSSTSQPDRSLERAVSLGLSLLQRSGPAFLAASTESCVSCHHQALPAMAVGLARDRGMAVDDKLARAEADDIHSNFVSRRERLLQGTGIPDRLDACYLLVALAAHRVPRDKITDALVHYLTLKQMPDGRWRTTFHRPPMDDGDFTTTALSLRSLKLYSLPGRREEINQRIVRARKWLLSATPVTTEDRSFHLLGLAWADADPKMIAKARNGLLTVQGKDGGWGQLSTLASDAYATGQALVALHQAGGMPVVDPAYSRGVNYLRRTQREDGSWFVQTRSVPVQPYFESGFPHGRSQYISCAATAWATMALTLTLPEKRRSGT